MQAPALEIELGDASLIYMAALPYNTNFSLPCCYHGKGPGLPYDGYRQGPILTYRQWTDFLSLITSSLASRAISSSESSSSNGSEPPSLHRTMTLWRCLSGARNEMTSLTELRGERDS